MRTVAVIGAGQMGSGIAHVCALSGLTVGLHDVSKERIEAGARCGREAVLPEVLGHRFAAAGRFRQDEDALG